MFLSARQCTAGSSPVHSKKQFICVVNAPTLNPRRPSHACEKLTEHGDLLNEPHHSFIVSRDTRQRKCFQPFSIGMARQKPLLKGSPKEMKKMGAVYAVRQEEGHCPAIVTLTAWSRLRGGATVEGWPGSMSARDCLH